MKRLCMLVSLMLIALCFPVIGQAAVNPGWTLEDNTLYITSDLSDYTLASSSSPYFTRSPFEAAGIQSQVQTIVVEEGVKKIGGLSFYGMRNLTKVILPSTLEEIHGEAFMDCSQLTSITIPMNVSLIGPNAFQGCGLKTVTFEGDAPSVGGYSWFYDGYSNSSCFPASSKIDVYYNSDRNWTTSIMAAYGSFCLWHDITILDSGTCGDNATWSFNTHNVLTISGTGALATYHGGSATPWNSYNSRIKQVIIQEGITDIYSYTFEYMTNLVSVSLPLSLRYLACNAFNDCQSLPYIVIPGGIEEFASYPATFNRCNALQGIYYVGTQEEWESIENYQQCKLYERDVPVYFAVFHEEKAATCTENGWNAYYAFDGTDNSMVYSVEKQLISGIPYTPLAHTAVTDAAVPATCTQTGLTEGSHCSTCGQILVAQEEVPALGHSPTWNTYSAVPALCDYVGYGGYSECTRCRAKLSQPSIIPALGHDYVDGKCSRYHIVETGQCGSNATWVYDSHGVLTISGSGAIDYYSSGSRTPWADYMFTIRKVIVREGITEIPSYTFEYMFHLESISLPSSLSFLACNAFNDCHTLPYIIIPGSLQTFASWKNFNRCDALKDIYYVGTEEEWQQIINYQDCISGDGELTYHFATLHNEESATCTSNGNECYYSLDVNGAVSNYAENKQPLTEIPIIEAFGHDWDSTVYEWSEDHTTVSATHVCKHDQSHVETETVSASSSVSKAPTCTEKGETTYTGNAFTNPAFRAQTITLDNIGALDHDLIHHDAQAPTCTAIGWDAYDACSRCDYTTYVEKSALGHDWNNPVYTWNEAHTELTATHICKQDEDHVETETVDATSSIAEEPTCTTLGKTTYTSEPFTNESFSVQTLTLTDIPALGHDWHDPVYTWNDNHTQLTATRICKRNQSHIETETVNATSAVTEEATCLSMGKTTYTSGAFTNNAFRTQTLTLTDIAALGHDLISHEAKEPTCTEIGWDAYETCSRCDHTTYAEKAALGHDWNNPIYTWHENQAQLTATRVCKRNESHAETETVDVTSNVVEEATCITMGKTTYTSEAFTNAAFSAQVMTLTDVPALSHDWNDPVYTWNENHTQLTATHVCKRNENHVETETVDATSDVTLAPTFTEMGETTYTSGAFTNPSFAVQALTLTDIPVLDYLWGTPAYTWSEGHSQLTAERVSQRDESQKQTETVNVSAEITVEPTCTTMGMTTYTSEAFTNEAFSAQTLTLTDIPALEHDWHKTVYSWNENHTQVTATHVCKRNEEHVETETADATSAVAEEATCTGMGKTTYTSGAFTNAAFKAQTLTLTDIPALDHDLITHTAKEPTCTEVGWDAYETCSRCDHTTYAEKPALGHDPISHDAKEPTCTEVGWDAYETCGRCDHTTYAEKPALGHDPISHDAKEPTCTEVGWDAYETCSRCDHTTYTEKAALGHDPISHEAKEPTCTEVGWDAYETCSRCDHTTYTEKPALDHIWGEVVYSWHNDKLTAERICTRDETHKEAETVGSTGIIISPTEETEGLITRTSEAFENKAFEQQEMKITIPTLKDMKVLYLPVGLEEIEEEAFADGTFTAVIIPDGCKTIRTGAFAGCVDLIYVQVPEGTDIEDGAFEEKVILDKVKFGAEENDE